ncbi:MAG: UbiD family decarboxylase associated with menaquinone via futalosine [uncultured Pyrinomonadaceae bacterium]|uniref:UbiD family decarboxylase associated with menaquinone via futalosine n=1 Tax=uncultured Pyrinomonadaceae bacterium TaxID=2283094 RepID=A0A6J4P1Z2_9BACT|nr:MAG: UbiD family decarboxylase associated with menaquinone via futalosine [uncultured Pyrinomonadaceae bacterium]
MHKNLRSFIEALRKENDLIEIEAMVDPYLEIAEIHRRVIENQGKALLFKNVKNSVFPVVTNLFGTNKRIELAFTRRPQEFVKTAVEMIDVLLPPKPKELWKYRQMAFDALKLGTKTVKNAPILERFSREPKLTEVPLLQLWHEDGGHFVTLPLVYTESPTSGKHNLGMYRIQRYDDVTTGIHWQIGKGGGFHHYEAERMNQPLPVNITVGGAPAMILAAIAPLPEDVPELMLASLLADGKIETVKNPLKNGLRLIAEAEFVFSGVVPPKIRRPEGPFGDHYGYYSLRHDYPVFECQAIFHRKDAIYPATVVGKPRQEDFYIGDYLQELLSPLFPLVMPAVKDLWSYGETGFHSLAAAVVKERYAREALGAGFRILGEGQLSLTKFLLLTDKPQDLRNFKSLFEHILERVDWASDFFIFDRTSFDTLDYASGKINHGSKAMLVGVGEAKRDLKRELSGELSSYLKRAEVFCGGCLVVEGASYAADEMLAERIAASGKFDDWQIIVLHDSADYACSVEKFLWATWTRFNPSTDIYAAETQIENNHIVYRAPIVIDARMKPWYPKEVEPRADIVKLVDDRWREYFPKTE